MSKYLVRNTQMKPIPAIESRFQLRLFILLIFTSLQAKSISGEDRSIILGKDTFRIVLASDQTEPVNLAVEALRKDFQQVMGFKPQVASQIGSDKTITELVVVNRNSGATKVPPSNKSPDGFESHRIYADHSANKIYLEGYDLRGTIFAIYTFSEEILGVPPLYIWSSWIPEKRTLLKVPASLDRSFKSPQVRYRSLLPGDQDFFNPWEKLSVENRSLWLETALRLKLNTVETYSSIAPGYKLTDYAYSIGRHGLVITSHHTSGLNTSFSTWDAYWTKVRKLDPPKLLLANETAIKDFFRYNAETVHRSGIENLWVIAFRGKVDQPFWSVFEDAPADDKGRGEVINEMLQLQLDLIKEITGNPNPYARITFYDEMANLMSQGFLKPPEGENLIWTYVAARRDPYPYDDLVNFSAGKPVKLGYYMNFGFASTGAHVAPAEGPWKMEFNYRYINNKSPLYFSVVNVGNIREFVFELSANAKLLWDYNSYSTDQFLLDFCSQYFGAKPAREVAQLYRDFYHAYWQPKQSEFEGMERQFLFQDLRYARAFDHIYEHFYAAGTALNLNPLHQIGYESVPGRTFRIDPAYHKTDNQIDAILSGMQLTIPKFESVATRCSRLKPKLDPEKQLFFNDNLRIYCYYMTHLSKALYHFVFAYKHQSEKELLLENLTSAQEAAVRAKQYLYEAQHGVFSTWYSDAEPMTRTFQLDSLISKIEKLKQRAVKKNQ